MKKNKKFNTLEEGILLLQRTAQSKPISIHKILFTLSVKGRALVLILLCLPFCQPLQIPGLSLPFGLVIAFIGLRMAFGRHIWLPKIILSKKIPVKTFKKITHKTLVLVRKIKHWIHPRVCWMCSSKTMRIINSLVIFILGIFLALPLPVPLTNLVAGWSILLIALGILEDDGVLVLIGYFITVLTFILFTVIILSLEGLF